MHVKQYNQNCGILLLYLKVLYTLTINYVCLAGFKFKCMLSKVQYREECISVDREWKM